MHTGVAHNHHNVRVHGELVYVGRESGVLDLHSLKLRLGLATAQLELFDDVGNLFEPVGIEMGRSRMVLHHAIR